MKEHEGKVAFITGANRGIGFETARGLGEEGVTVILGARDQAKGEEAAEKLKAEGISAIAFKFDVDHLPDHQEVFQYITKKFGKLDILVNNAGVMPENTSGPEVKKASTIPMDVLHKTFDTNFFNLVALTQTLLPLIKKSSAGRIVNLSSILGSLSMHSNPKSPVYDFKTFAYNASKTALNAFTVHLAYELKNTSIKVNSAHPGWVKTEMGGANAPLEVKDGAKTSIELALLDETGPTGLMIHLNEPLPW